MLNPLPHSSALDRLLFPVTVLSTRDPIHLPTEVRVLSTFGLSPQPSLPSLVSESFPDRVQWPSECLTLVIMCPSASRVSAHIQYITSVHFLWASPVAQLVKNPPAMWQTWVRSLGWEDPLEKGKATHSSILAWRIPRTL